MWRRAWPRAPTTTSRSPSRRRTCAFASTRRWPAPPRGPDHPGASAPLHPRLELADRPDHEVVTHLLLHAAAQQEAEHAPGIDGQPVVRAGEAAARVLELPRAVERLHVALD